VRDEEKRQDNKKIKKVLYFTYLGEAPNQPICPKSRVLGDVHDVIMCAKFQIVIFMGYDFTGGRIFDFPINFCMGLTVQCDDDDDDDETCPSGDSRVLTCDSHQVT